jgi:hypothetical protein
MKQRYKSERKIASKKPEEDYRRSSTPVTRAAARNLSSDKVAKNGCTLGARLEPRVDELGPPWHPD